MADVKALRRASEADALEVLRRAGTIESVSALSTMLGWERRRTQRMLTKWQQDGAIVREPGPGGRTVIKTPSAALPAARAPAQVPVPHDAHPGAQPAHPAQPVLRWAFGALFALLSAALYLASLFLNARFWSSLAPSPDSKDILVAGGAVIETINYAVPSAISIASISRGFKFWLWLLWGATMIAGATAGASFVRSNLGAAEVARAATISERIRLEGVIGSAVKPVPNDAVKDARARVETAKANHKTTCAPTRTLDLDACNKARAELLKAEAALATENANYANAIATADQQHRIDVEKAQAALKALPAISEDRNVVLAGVAALVPSASEAVVNGIVAALWIALFGGGPCLLLRLAMALLAPIRPGARP